MDALSASSKSAAPPSELMPTPAAAISRKQEVVDRLVASILEQDVLYVRVWLDQMRDEGMLEESDPQALAEGLRMKHSWCKLSALEAAVWQDYTTLRLFILHLLLLQGVMWSQLTALEHRADSARQGWAVKVVRDWDRTGFEQAAGARHFLTLSLQDSADWLDKNLPPHPSPASCTGCGSLPARPDAPSQPATTRPSSSVPTVVPAPHLAAPQPSSEATDVDPKKRSTSAGSSTTAFTSTPATIPSSSVNPPSPERPNGFASDDADARAHPSLPPPSWGDPHSQVRLSSVAIAHDAASLKAFLPPLSGLLSIKRLFPTTWILTFARKSLAELALDAIRRRKVVGSIASQLEVDYQVSIGFGPPRPLPARLPTPQPSLAAAPSPPELPTLAPALLPPALPMAATSRPHTVRLGLYNLPLNTTREEAVSLFAFAGVTLLNAVMVHASGGHRSYCKGQVANGVEFARASATLHESVFYGRTLFLARDGAKISSNAPFRVVVDNVSPLSDIDTSVFLPKLAYTIGAGACGYELKVLPGGGMRGVMRLETEEEAQLAAQRINRQRKGGRFLSAEVRPSIEDEPLAAGGGADGVNPDELPGTESAAVAPDASAGLVSSSSIDPSSDPLLRDPAALLPSCSVAPSVPSTPTISPAALPPPSPLPSSPSSSAVPFEDDYTSVTSSTLPSLAAEPAPAWQRSPSAFSQPSPRLPSPFLAAFSRPTLEGAASSARTLRGSSMGEDELELVDLPAKEATSPPPAFSSPPRPTASPSRSGECSKGEDVVAAAYAEAAAARGRKRARPNPEGEKGERGREGRREAVWWPPRYGEGSG
ncbi:hypothetical protein JCM10207_007288 [Rhodosporidiobolus poonsookiae]